MSTALAPQPLTAAEAYEIASQWGSLVTNGDPGYVFYTFSGDLFTVQNEELRANMISYTEGCLVGADEEHKQELTDLLAFIKTANIAPELDEFTTAYIRAMLWSTTGPDFQREEDEEDGGDAPLDDNFTPEQIDAATLKSILEECAQFQKDNGPLLIEENFTGRKDGSVLSRAGHDFWLTREGHGAGFWDGDWTEPAATKLTRAAKAFGEYYLEVGDDKRIYGS